MTSNGWRMMAPICTITGLSRIVLALLILTGLTHPYFAPHLLAEPALAPVAAEVREEVRAEEVDWEKAQAEKIQAEALREAAPSRAGPRGLQITLEASAYTCGPESTGKRPVDPGYCVTASGYRLRPGDKVVAMGKKYPFGTQVMIPGYGLATVRDRGGAISDNHVDLYFERLEDALRWGRRMVTATVVFAGGKE
jgi:3D (Asp-Asp-Asp) domain-containing protein